jgi:hypothetical protein
MSVEVVVGVSVVSALFIAFGVVVGSEHQILRDFSYLFAIVILGIIPGTLTIDEYPCYVVVANTTTVGDFTSIEYEDYCTERVNGSSALTWAFYIAWFVIIIYCGLGLLLKTIAGIQKLRGRGK